MLSQNVIFSYNKTPTPPLQRQTSHAPPIIKNEKTKLQELREKSERVLLNISTVFPFDLFPDSLVIDPTKVHIIIREFFASEQIHSIPIKNIVDVYIETSPFFATIRILPQMIFEHQATEVKMLWKSDALRARNIIQGLIVATKQDIDVAKLPQQENIHQLRHDLEKLGREPASDY